MMILGEKDYLIPAEVGRESVKINPNINWLVISGAAHVPFLSHQSKVLDAVTQFILAEEV